MKLRIEGSSLRLRVSKTDLETLRTENRVSEECPFPNGASLRYSLVASQTHHELAVSFEDQAITVFLPVKEKLVWIDSDQVGYDTTLDLENEKLHLLLEKDFKCLHRDNGEQKDLFPNPESTDRG